MFSRVLARTSVRRVARLSATSSSSSAALRASLTKRWMGGGGGHGHDHHASHSSGPPPTPRVRAEEDKYPMQPSQQEQPPLPEDHPDRKEYWESVFRMNQRYNPFHYTDPRSATWFKDIPSDLPQPDMTEVRRSAARYWGPRVTLVAVVAGLGLYFYLKPKAVAYLEGKDKKAADAKKGDAKATAAPAAAAAAAAAPKQGVLDASGFGPLKLIEIRPYNHNTKSFVFELETADTKLNCPTTSFVLVKSPNKTDDGKDVIRPYTPIDSHVLGQLHLLVKQYPGGLLTTYLHGLKVGDTVLFKGPVKKLEYKPNMKKHIGMIAGGTGITPMLQVIDEVLSNPNDTTKLSLLFANDTAADILLRERLDDLKTRFADRFTVNYVLLKPKEGEWKGEKGYVTEALIKKYMPAPSADSLVFVCGPPPMMKALSGEKVKNPTTGAMEQGALSGALANLKYTSDTVFKF